MPLPCFQLPCDELVGLRPRTWVAVGPGFVREEIKETILKEGGGFVKEAVTTAQEIALLIVSGARMAENLPRLTHENVLTSSLSRQDALRALIADPRIGGKLPELKRLRRQSGFYRRLDRSLQAGRAAFAHDAEEAVYVERLEQRFAEPSGAASDPARRYARPVRDETRRLAEYYEAWLRALTLWDPPLLLRDAAAVLKDAWPVGVPRPARVIHLHAQALEGLELDFWESLGRYVTVERVGPAEIAPASDDHSAGSSGLPAWDRWHTLDDAADALAENLVEAMHARPPAPAPEAAPDAAADVAVLIPDTPAVRRTLLRALAERGIALADPRDPTRLRWEEEVKALLLPLQLVARGYRRENVQAWLTHARHRGGAGADGQADPARIRVWREEINARGLRTGLGGYAGGELADLHARLVELNTRFAGRRTCADLARAHGEWVREHAPAWAVFIEAQWKAFGLDLERLEQHRRTAPPLYWLERFQERLAQASPPVERLKPPGGLRIYRLSQAPRQAAGHVIFFGLPADWLAGQSLGDYWWSERERETLGAEFAIRSGLQVRAERLAVLQAWVGLSSRVSIADAEYDLDGREREPLAPTVAALFGELRESGGGELAPFSRGSHARWRESFGTLRTMPPDRIALPPLAATGGRAVPDMTATVLDHFSRCPVVALAQSRWKLSDLREPETDLWPDARGNILHLAVERLVESRDAEGNFGLTPERAIEDAWIQRQPRGLLRGERTARYVKRRLVEVLRVFSEKEREYFTRSGTRLVGQENVRLRLEYPDFSIHGTPDRIDEHPDGIFVMDYKTGSDLPDALAMMDGGYRLQLPFYALAAGRHYGKPVLGAQFIELNRSASRTKGIYFKAYNGKEPGKLTATTARAKSLLDLPRDEAWSRLEDQIKLRAAQWVRGEFIAQPNRASDCVQCMTADFCGYKRRISQRTIAADGDGEGGASGD